MLFIDSDGNFIGNVSFEGNHANFIGGKGNLEERFQHYDNYSRTKYTARF